MQCIAIDWGSSSFRAYLLDNGKLLETCNTDEGALRLTRDEFEPTVQKNCGHWFEGTALLLTGGMAGSQNGWHEAPYVSCPATLNDLAEQLVSPGHSLPFPCAIVPGVRTITTSGVPDVMRGEELQIFGAARLGGMAEGIFCLPGTHSKWARLKQHQIVQFSTYMSGELYTLMRKHSSLASLCNDDVIDADAFELGLEHTRANPALLNQLFTPRAMAVTGQMAEGQVSSYLSASIIASEILSASAALPCGTQINLVGDPALCQWYQRALTFFDYPGRLFSAGQAVLAGMDPLFSETLRV
ncbi:2-dehydro-3-deoxygalactonokinase [Lacimicrobium alkaliphilum]|uniref:MFS transporter n=1 Tax=Lacimicrobium alkaliphilum TaxID=1526571 RepID=A0ABQ1RAC8_9ALTE|nr:2-dehydro-3-deoxygalactonokinase [Lacimicrobium alkaliphilum]GGD60211.1 MFS transporter [Lacimicrobium alkaliphilum]